MSFRRSNNTRLPTGCPQVALCAVHYGPVGASAEFGSSQSAKAQNNRLATMKTNHSVNEQFRVGQGNLTLTFLALWITLGFKNDAKNRCEERGITNHGITKQGRKDISGLHTKRSCSSGPSSKRIQLRS